MAKSEDENKHLSYGFVKFSNVASAQLAMHDLNGVILCGRPLKIGKALSRSNKKEDELEHRQAYATASVHVTFISHQVERIVTEESLRFLFGRFGQVVDAIICKSNVDQRQARQSGYGFIHFAGGVEGVEASFTAAQTLSDVMIDEVNYKCKISKDLENQLKVSTVPPVSQPAPFEMNQFFQAPVASSLSAQNPQERSSPRSFGAEPNRATAHRDTERGQMFVDQPAAPAARLSSPELSQPPTTNSLPLRFGERHGNNGSAFPPTLGAEYSPHVFSAFPSASTASRPLVGSFGEASRGGGGAAAAAAGQSADHYYHRLSRPPSSQNIPSRPPATQLSQMQLHMQQQYYAEAQFSSRQAFDFAVEPSFASAGQLVSSSSFSRGPQPPQMPQHFFQRGLSRASVQEKRLTHGLEQFSQSQMGSLSSFSLDVYDVGAPASSSTAGPSSGLASYNSFTSSLGSLSVGVDASAFPSVPLPSSSLPTPLPRHGAHPIQHSMSSFTLQQTSQQQGAKDALLAALDEDAFSNLPHSSHSSSAL
eukprot:gene10497-7467_t